ncbi:MAG: hypothetical protein IH991_12585 [Planctomycetes bacterium]|nr:hypothetical protein [Planctomycetota bacterium]
MKQKADSQEKQNSNKTGQYGPHDRSGVGLRPSDRSIGVHADVPAGFQPMPLEPCLEYAAMYDPHINYAIVLVSLLLLLETRDAERRGRPAHQRAR